MKIPMEEKNSLEHTCSTSSCGIHLKYPNIGIHGVLVCCFGAWSALVFFRLTVNIVVAVLFDYFFIFFWLLFLMRICTYCEWGEKDTLLLYLNAEAEVIILLFKAITHCRKYFVCFSKYFSSRCLLFSILFF